MNIGAELTTEQKVAALTDAKSLIVKELYHLCLMVGVDPDTVDTATFDVSKIDLTPITAGRLLAIQKQLSNLSTITGKLEELNA